MRATLARLRRTAMRQNRHAFGSARERRLGQSRDARRAREERARQRCIGKACSGNRTDADVM